MEPPAQTVLQWLVTGKKIQTTQVTAGICVLRSLIKVSQQTGKVIYKQNSAVMNDAPGRV
jgi:hypothetical protein